MSLIFIIFSSYVAAEKLHTPLQPRRLCFLLSRKTTLPFLPILFLHRQHGPSSHLEQLLPPVTPCLNPPLYTQRERKLDRQLMKEQDRVFEGAKRRIKGLALVTILQVRFPSNLQKVQLSYMSGRIRSVQYS